MALPRQIQAALDAADATLAATNGTPPIAAPQVAVAQADPPPPELIERAPVLVEAPAEPPKPQPQKDVWEERYKSLQGLFNQQVPTLQEKVKTLQTNLDEAINRLNRASEQQERQPEKPQAADPKDVENFGADLVDMVSRVAGQAIGRAAQVLDSKVAQLDAQIAQLQATVKGTTQQVAMTAEQSFFDRVTKLVPEWEQVNTDPAFLAWLAETDPVYGINRQAALQKAQDSLNADHAAAVFKAFLGPQKTAPRAADPLDSQISPKSAATAQPTPVEVQVLTQAQITKFYDDVRRGMYRGNEVEATRLEQIINAALAEGRVR